jgi:uncharacterized Tic20 family protein
MSEKVELAELATQDERVMAALAHAGVVWPTVGLVAPLVIWATQREKSPFVRFQAVQAAAYQFILVVGSLVGSVFYLCSFLAFPLGFGFTAPFAEGLFQGLLCIPFFSLLLGLGIMFLLGLLWLAYIGYGIFGAVVVFQGKDFRYVILGPWLERYLARA